MKSSQMKCLPLIFVLLLHWQRASPEVFPEETLNAPPRCIEPKVSSSALVAAVK